MTSSSDKDTSSRTGLDRDSLRVSFFVFVCLVCDTIGLFQGSKRDSLRVSFFVFVCLVCDTVGLFQGSRRPHPRNSEKRSVLLCQEDQ